MLSLFPRERKRETNPPHPQKHTTHKQNDDLSFPAPEGFPALAGGLPQPAVEQLQRLTEKAVYLETTYLDEEMRVARGPGKEIYVLSRR